MNQPSMEGLSFPERSDLPLTREQAEAKQSKNQKGEEEYQLVDPSYRASAGQTDPQAIIGIERLIDLVEEVEESYPDDTPAQIVTRIRQLYYSYLGFDELLPNADNTERLNRANIRAGAAQYTERRIVRPQSESQGEFRILGQSGVSQETYDRLTAKADENAQGDNPSPYILLENGEQVDLGHLLLTLDALIHPGSSSPFTDYNVPTIDPASWVADIGISSVWMSYHLMNDRPHPEVKADIESPNVDAYYNASAPEEDLLGNADGFGLFKDWDNSPLSVVLRRYYLGEQGSVQPGQSRRWETFCRLSQFVVSEGNRLVWIADRNQLIQRINNFCDLYFYGKLSAEITMLTGHRRPPRSWSYTGTMLDKFLEYVRRNLINERGENI
ncbi:hypothetical protein [Baaleninema simplex]|uniref:hypothetical protein n=1 Tax=Baaleninema simplex TaxID=2862350 RepID=UPI00035FFB12|nr:hypothetical protein [Baaleninema simplex]